MQTATAAERPSASATATAIVPTQAHISSFTIDVDEEAPPLSAVSIVESPPDPSTTAGHSTASNPHNDHHHNHSNPDYSEYTFPDGGTRSWRVVLGSFFLLTASYGVMNTLGVLQSYLSTNQLATYSTSAIGWIPGLFVFLGLSLGVQVGPIFDRYGPRGICAVGSCCYISSLFLLAECRTYWHFLLCLGVLGGIGAALLSTVAMAVIPHWFQRRAGLAMGIAMAGSGVGGTIFPFVLRAGFSRWGFRWGIRLLACVVTVVCVLGSMFVKSRLPRGRAKATVNLRCFQDSRFTWLTIGTFGMSI
jgi:MFS family permease